MTFKSLSGIIFKTLFYEKTVLFAVKKEKMVYSVMSTSYKKHINRISMPLCCWI